MNELDLREALERATGDVPSRDLVPGLWASGRRRRRGLAVGSALGAAAVTAAVVMGVVTVVPDAPTPDVAVTPTPTSGELLPPSDPELAKFYESLLALPVVSSRDSAPTYVLDGQAWYGKVIKITRAAQGTIAADDLVVSSKAGWIGQVLRPEGVVSGFFGPIPSDDFEPFPYQDRSNPQVFVASLDGRYVAMGGSLLNGDGERIGSLPTNVADAQAWTPAGLVYSDSAGGAWLWNPGRTTPVPLPSTYNLEPDGWGIVREDSCWSVYRLRAGQTAATEEFRHCGAYPVVSLGPAWFAGPRLALTADGAVLETSRGREVQRLDLPPFLISLREQLHLHYGGWWRGNHEEPRRALPKVYVSLTVDLRRATGTQGPERYRAFILECKVETGECGRFLTRYVSTPDVPFVWRP